MACVHVSTNRKGLISGQLEWNNLPTEDVEFTLQQIKPGYIVVGDVITGPEVFKKVCWRLKSISGTVELSLSSIAPGLKLFLDGPSWALERLNVQDSGSASVFPNSPIGQSPIRNRNSPDAFLVKGKYDAYASPVLRPTKIVKKVPAIPKLNLDGVHGEPIRGQATKIVTDCGQSRSWLAAFFCAGKTDDESTAEKPVCTDFWHCM
eukprot:TRINITY_DN73081_c0_g1_i1.p1 TRINITY_DN73081_c0_g1~~TRINITY_DN73081_c0_g1_i1.p1  ORF type:complete len:229 (-),score=19.86 TRINITY_DN73081_c0_g1_i1:70-687(-)